MKSLFFFVGTEAEFIKIFPVCQQLEREKVPYHFIFSGQNQASRSKLLQYCPHPTSVTVLSDGQTHTSAFSLLAWFIRVLISGSWSLRSQLSSVPSGSIMIVHGDTISTVMGTLIARLYGLKVAHIEAGLRSFNWLQPFPEEIDRVITSNLAHLHYAPNDWAASNLGDRQGIVNTGENTLIDSMRQVLDDNKGNVARKMIPKGKYFIFALHRQENLADKAFVTHIISLIQNVAKEHQCLFILHEPTREVLENLGLLDGLKAEKNIYLSHRIPYSQFMRVVEEADFFVSDGGSNQEECYYFGLPFLILRNYTERIEGLNENAVLSKKNFKTINHFLKNLHAYRKPPFTSTSSPSRIIAESLIQKIS